MYTIGQLANIIGISRDKLRYYEERGILVPKQNKNNNYREYTDQDIDTVLAIEYYRSLDLSFKTISQLHKESSLNKIENVLDKKYDEINKEIKRLNEIKDRIENVKIECEDIKKCLNQFEVRTFKPVKIIGAISDFRSYDEFDVVHNKQTDDTPIVKKMIRFVQFDHTGLKGSHMYITRNLDTNDNKQDVLEYDHCLYTIVLDSVDQNAMEETFIKSIQWFNENQKEPIGVAIIRMLLMEYDENNVKSYLEVYIPIK